MKISIAKILPVVCMTLIAAALCGCSASQSAQAAQAGADQVDLAYIKENAGTIKLLDVRDFKDYAGELNNDADRKGHIPGAISLPYENMLDKEGQPIADVRLGRMFSHAKLAAEDEVVVYGSGDADVQGAVGLLQKLGYANAKACMASYDEWAADESNEVEKSSLSCCAG